MFELFDDLVTWSGDSEESEFSTIRLLRRFLLVSAILPLALDLGKGKAYRERNLSSNAQNKEEASDKKAKGYTIRRFKLIKKVYIQSDEIYLVRRASAFPRHWQVGGHTLCRILPSLSHLFINRPKLR